MPFRTLEDITMADVAFEVIGKDLNELFTDSAIATFSEMVDIFAISPNIKSEINIEAETLDDLLFKWLEHLIYLKDADTMWFCKFEVYITKNSKYELKAYAFGEKIVSDPKKMRTDVKAITRHLFSIQHFQKGWKATFVLDI